MTNVLSIDGTGGTAQDVAVKFFPKTNLQRLRQTIDASGRETTIYVDSTSDPNSPVTVAVSSGVDARPDAAGTRTRRSSITLSSYARVVDGDGALLALKRISCVIALNTPDADMEPDDLRDLFLNAVSVWINTLTAKVPDTETISALRFGITDVLS